MVLHLIFATCRPDHPKQILMYSEKTLGATKLDKVIEIKVSIARSSEVNRSEHR